MVHVREWIKQKDLAAWIPGSNPGTLPAVALAIVLRRSGDLSEEPEPDPISNSAVKLLSADGT